MKLDSAGSPKALVICLGLGGSLLAVGAALLTSEEFAQSSWGIDIGPVGANFVVMGAIISACGFWMSWHRLKRRTCMLVCGLLLVVGCGLLILSAGVEPFLTRVVAIAALVSGMGGAARCFDSMLPQFRHDGAMSLGEKLAVTSLIANGLIASYLLLKSQTLASDGAPGADGTFAVMMTTLIVVVAILLAESLGLRILQGRADAPNLEDERDIGIRAAAGQAAYATLVVGLVILSAQLGLGGVSTRTAAANDALGLSSPTSLAHVLLALLFLSQAGRSLAEIWQYGRARL